MKQRILYKTLWIQSTSVTVTCTKVQYALGISPVIHVCYTVLTIDTSSMSLFFLKSPKHSGLLVEVVTKNVIEMGRKPLIDLCRSLGRKTFLFYLAGITVKLPSKAL